LETPIYGYGDKDAKSSPPAAISQPKIHANALASGAPQAPLGVAYRAPPEPLFRGGEWKDGRREERREKGGGEVGKREGRGPG